MVEIKRARIRRSSKPALLALVALAACPGSSKPNGTCDITDDCVKAGIKDSHCLNGMCIQQCSSDDECRQRLCGADAGCPAEAALQICEDHVCKTGCSDTSCMAGEICTGGHCAIYSESFEPGMLDPRSNTLARHCNGSSCWNDIARPRRNNVSEIVATGDFPGCSIDQPGIPAAPPEKCAGPAGEGAFFLSVGRVPTTARGTIQIGATCASCFCCEVCRDPASRDQNTQFTCLGMRLPASNMCTMAVPAECSTFCNDCDTDGARCPAEAGMVDPQLTSCESPAAAHACTACTPYDACLTGKEAEISMCSMHPEQFGRCQLSADPQQIPSECRSCLDAECEPMRAACMTCRDASKPDSTAAQRAACDAQGVDGCFPAPKTVMRSGLSEDEQSIESPEIKLAAASSGEVVLSFEFIPYNVGACYTRVIQGTTNWPTELQEVVVQMCGANCTDAASWRTVAVSGAKPSSACPASAGLGGVPDDQQRANGLQFAQQDSHDWAANFREVPIPADLRTDSFRFRFLPHLADRAEVGIDRIEIRRR